MKHVTYLALDVVDHLEEYGYYNVFKCVILKLIVIDI